MQTSVGETCQNLKRLNWHNSCFKIATTSSFGKILNAHFSKDYCKDTSYIVIIITKLEGTECTDRNTMDCTPKPIQKAIQELLHASC